MTPTPLSDQAQAWSRVAPRYAHEFVDPFRPDVANPVLAALERLPHKAFVAAEPIRCECLAMREKTRPDEGQTFNTQSMLGGALLGQK